MLAEAIEEIVRELTSRTEKLAPQFLYHYTTAEAFMGVCRNNELWLGDVRFMNDPSELSFGQKVAHRALQCFVDKPNAAIIVDVVREALAGLVSRTIQQPTIFAFSLCSRGDSLSQWRQYGDQGRGYSIGFRSRTLLIPKDDSALGLFRVRYTQQDQEEIFTLFYSSMVESLRSWDGIWDRPLVLRQIAMGISIISSVMKDRSYEAEQEWRLVVVLSAKRASEILFMAKRSSIKPYIVRPFAELFGSDREFAGTLVTSVTLGPVLEPVVKEGVEMFISSTRYSSVKVGISKVPIRDVL